MPRRGHARPAELGRGHNLVTARPEITDRFRRSGEELCHGSRFALSEPVFAAKGWSCNSYGGGTDITVRSDLTCQ